MVKAGVVDLKKVCRQRTLTAWKEWRASMEQHRGASLRVRTPPLYTDALCPPPFDSSVAQNGVGLTPSSPTPTPMYRPCARVPNTPTGVGVLSLPKYCRWLWRRIQTLSSVRNALDSLVFSSQPYCQNTKICSRLSFHLCITPLDRVKPACELRAPHLYPDVCHDCVAESRGAAGGRPALPPGHVCSCRSSGGTRGSVC